MLKLTCTGFFWYKLRDGYCQLQKNTAFRDIIKEFYLFFKVHDKFFCPKDVEYKVSFYYSQKIFNINQYDFELVIIHVFFFT